MNDRLEKQKYTLIYYEWLQKMNYQYTDYVILDTLIRKSKKNEFNKSKAFLHQRLYLARNTINSILRKLKKQGLIEEERPKQIILNYMAVEDFQEMKKGKYIKIYHKHRKELGLSLKEYSLLYAFYSLSTRQKHASAKVKRYEEWLGIKEREYHRIKKKLENAGYILPHKRNKVVVSLELCNWFNSQNEVFKYSSFNV